MIYIEIRINKQYIETILFTNVLRIPYSMQFVFMSSVGKYQGALIFSLDVRKESSQARFKGTEQKIT